MARTSYIQYNSDDVRLYLTNTLNWRFSWLKQQFAGRHVPPPQYPDSGSTSCFALTL